MTRKNADPKEFAVLVMERDHVGIHFALTHNGRAALNNFDEPPVFSKSVAP
jgi:hypothetical protein